MPNNKLKIVTISAEVAPFSKAGGLGDVARSLPKALKRKGHKVIAISPLHGVIDPKKHKLKKLGNDIPIKMDETKTLSFDYWRGYLMEDLPVYFIDRKSYFSGFKTIYGTKISNERFFFFNLAAIKLIELLNLAPDIIHCNDWHTGLIPYFIRKRFKKSEYISKAATVYTIHNLAYQSGHAKNTLKKPDDADSRLPRFTDTDALKGINFAKRAIVNSDLINTVSEQYAKEIMTPKFGEDLNRILKNRINRVFGIVNGIDYDIFNPKKDPDIKKHYSHRSLGDKVANKLDLQKKFKLPKNKDIPLLGMVTRITEQKGFDLLMKIADDLLAQDIQLVLAGSGDKTYENFFRKLQKKYPKKVGAHLEFDTKKAVQIYAGSDIFLMPSRFEPCGLGQLISMRYGSVPLVHAVGGLVDTITDYDPKTKKGNGFVFNEYDPKQFLIAVIRAIETYQHNEAWKKLVITGMKQSHSWEIPAEKYAELFRRAIKLKNHNRK
ncbi:starch synthase [bacterium]|jgi:starch synthase|nr:starch synthase [bacterium]MDP6571516.1 glycogen/starch synthase [Patescibacteria group bacterium]|tara:strand:+ start:1861 stop:3336 length:1476 start_codon:yes stop_codon:yes gene_type:complete